VVSRVAISLFRPIKLIASAVLSPADQAILVDVWLELKRSICDPYRPERHYMRGPGPIPVKRQPH
jgi:hypothetical protein